MNVNTPILIKIASLIWLAFGIIIFSILLCLALIPIFFDITDQVGIDTSDTFSIILLIITISISTLVGYLFLRIGWLTLKGKAKDTLGNSIGSLLLTVFLTVPLIYSGSGGQVIFGLLASALLILAFVCALVGRNDYKKWASGNRNS